MHEVPRLLRGKDRDGGMNMEMTELLKFIRLAEMNGLQPFIDERFTLVLHKESDTKMPIPLLNTREDMRCLVIEQLARPAFKGADHVVQKQIRDTINHYLNTRFTAKDMELIYLHIAKRPNRERTKKFIRKGYDMQRHKREGEIY